MKVLFLDFDGVLNEFYPNNTRYNSDCLEFEENNKLYEQYKEVNNFMFGMIKKYDFCKDDKTAPHLWAITDLDYGKIQWLNKVVEKTDCKIVFSTSWRGDGVDNLAFYLCMKGFLYPKSCIGRTGRKKGTIMYNDEPMEIGSCRGLEIQEWLEIKGAEYNVKSFAILDDEGFDINTFYQSEFVQVKGLTEKDADDVIEILNG